jgi:hypothetical protein
MMAASLTQASLDQHAEVIADLLADLPWCDCTGYLVAEEENVEPDPTLNQYLQAFDVLVWDGYVADFVRLVRSLCDDIKSRLDSHELDLDLSVDCQSQEDPNLVALSMMVHYYGEDDAYLNTRQAVLTSFERIVRQAVEEWTQEDEEDEEPVETLV